MMSASKEYIYWMEDPEWSYYDEKKKDIVLTDKAPDKARISFEKWKKLNNFN